MTKSHKRNPTPSWIINVKLFNAKALVLILFEKFCWSNLFDLVWHRVSRKFFSWRLLAIPKNKIPKGSLDLSAETLLSFLMLHRRNFKAFKRQFIGKFKRFSAIKGEANKDRTQPLFFNLCNASRLTYFLL